MRERAEQSLKILCWVLVAVLLFQLVRAFVRNFPFARVTLPAVPTLSISTNAAAETAANPGEPVAAKKPPFPGTNQPLSGTNFAATNSLAKLGATNVPATTNLGTNLPVVGTVHSITNFSLPTNSAVSTNAAKLTNSAALTNAIVSTNAPAQTNTTAGGTNDLPATAAHKKSTRPHLPMGMGMGFGMPGMGKSLPDFPPVTKARIDRIVASELLGPVPHPLPMALLGIAGDVAFLRSASGETGLVKTGDSLGDLKLLRIGINRVLIELNGEKQELTIFDGLGGESLLTDIHSNETTNH